MLPLRKVPRPPAMRWPLLLLLLAMAWLPAPGLAGAAPARGKPAGTVAPTKISALLRTLLLARQAGRPVPGPDLGLHWPVARTWQAASVRFSRVLAPAEQKGLEGGALRFQRRPDGSAVRVGPIYAVELTLAALPLLERHPLVERVDAPGFPGPRPWVRHNLEDVRAPPVWPRTDAQGRPLTGQGIVIGDIDGTIDVFHPSFFQADGGLYPWIDADGDGRFSPGQDAVDLDGDGQAGPGETLRLLDGALHFTMSWDRPWTENDDGVLQPELDWLYADANGNGERDFGPLAGFGEADPTYGERLFLADDVDGNGLLDPGEKLLALGSSKIRAHYSLHSSQERRRGVDLIRVPRPTVASHGTGVVGILVGNVAGRSAFTGMAPDAEVVFVDQDGSEGDDSASQLIAGLDWLGRQPGVRVVLHEYGWPLFTFGDGSTNLEQAIDELGRADVVQCTAAHNFAESPMHAVGRVPARGTWELPLEVFDYPGYSVVVVYGTLRWRQPEMPLGITLIFDDGEVLRVQEHGAQLPDGRTVVGTAAERSARGTWMINFYYYRLRSNELVELPPGRLTVQIDNPGAAAQDADFFTADDTGAATLIALQDDLTSAGTVAWPGTADTAITVGAYRGNFELWGDGIEQGALRGYSGRDPRIDGESVLDLAAPDDSPTAAADPALPWGQYNVFSGTSGALPVVAGTVALLRQARPELDAAAILAQLHRTARQDRFTGAALPHPGWGYGKVDAFAAIFEDRPPGNTPPRARVQLEGEAFAGRPVRLDAGASSDMEDGAAGLLYRWDLGYDGTWEGEAAPAAQWSFGPVAAGSYWVLLEVLDSGGLTDRALLQVEVVEPPPPPVDAGTPAEDGGAAADLGLPDGGAGTGDAGAPGPDAGASDSGGGGGGGGGGGEGGGGGAAGGRRGGRAGCSLGSVHGSGATNACLAGGVLVLLVLLGEGQLTRRRPGRRANPGP